MELLSSFYFFAVVKETLLPHVAIWKQVSVLTDQVEAQGVKISDLQSSLEEHQHKLDSTEEMLQQVNTTNTSAQLEKSSHTLGLL